MKFYFLHNHYIPFEVKNGPIQVESVIVPEFYSNLNKVYIGEYCGFDSVETYIDYVTKYGYYLPETVFSIENIIFTRYISLMFNNFIRKTNLTVKS